MNKTILSSQGTSWLANNFSLSLVPLFQVHVWNIFAHFLFYFISFIFFSVEDFFWVSLKLGFAMFHIFLIWGIKS